MKKTRKNPRGKRPNPASKLSGGLTEMLLPVVGDLIVRSALVGCSHPEKVIIAAFIPEFVRLIRTAASPKDIQEAADKITDNIAIRRARHSPPCRNSRAARNAKHSLTKCPQHYKT